MGFNQPVLCIRLEGCMTNEELDLIRAWDRRCGDNESTFFPVTLDRRRLLRYVDELRAELAALKGEPTPQAATSA
jgi:hypothetical protein